MSERVHWCQGVHVNVHLPFKNKPCQTISVQHFPTCEDEERSSEWNEFGCNQMVQEHSTSPSFLRSTIAQVLLTCSLSKLRSVKKCAPWKIDKSFSIFNNITANGGTTFQTMAWFTAVAWCKYRIIQSNIFPNTHNKSGPTVSWKYLMPLFIGQ